MEAKIIDINDYEYAGEGANGASYHHKTDKSLMLKLCNASAPVEMVRSELEVARKVYEAGIPTPRPGEFVTDGAGRYGILFQRIPGKVSFSRATGDNPERVEEYARRFAAMCRQLHSTHLPKGLFPDIKEADLKMLAESPYFKPEEREMVERFIKSAPDGDTAIHGDLQFSNAIMSDSGEFFIDLGDFSCGHPYFDLGMVLLCTVRLMGKRQLGEMELSEFIVAALVADLAATTATSEKDTLQFTNSHNYYFCFRSMLNSFIHHLFNGIRLCRHLRRHRHKAVGSNPGSNPDTDATGANAGYGFEREDDADPCAEVRAGHFAQDGRAGTAPARADGD